MKKWTWVLFIISFIMMLTGCTKDEVIHVGTPVNGGIDFHKEITDSEAIKILRELVAEAEEIDEPKNLKINPELFFLLDRPKEGVSEIRRYVYEQDDGSSILYIEGISGPDGFPDKYFTLDEKQTIALKNVLQ